MPSNKPCIMIRTDKTTATKAAYIASKENRSLSNYGETMIKKAIENYEAQHGPIDLPEND